MEAYIEYKDLKHLIPALKEDIKNHLREEFAQEQFISYPKGMQLELFGEVTEGTYHRVYRLWIKKGFPRTMQPKGVWRSELKAWQKNQKL
jgi:hypothetical protein